MRTTLFAILLLALMGALGSGCATISPPTGGSRDTLAPKLLGIAPADSQLNIRPRRIELQFDEYVVLKDPGTEIQISPLLPIPLTAEANLKRVRLSIPDTLLQENTTYRITFGNAIQDLHEGNPYGNASYLFSTGAYFDSLTVEGTVYNAATGLPDTAGVVMLQPATAGDSAILRQKPMYITPVGPGGYFRFAGLPNRAFRIYLLGDKGGNLTFEGNGERIAFLEEPVMPRADSIVSVNLYAYSEGVDTTATTETGSGKRGFGGGRNGDPATAGGGTAPASGQGWTYTIAVDTADLRRRSKELTTPLSIDFTRKVGTYAAEKVFLSYDSAGITLEAPTEVRFDSTRPFRLDVQTAWKPDAVYTLRLQKGFAKDSAGTDVLPSRWAFRTKREEDYSKLQINLPSQYYGPRFVFQIMNGSDTVWQKPVTDTVIRLTRLLPGSFSLRVIEDRNGNGRWDAGKLLEKQQPERVFPYAETVNLKAGWEQIIDFKALEPRRPKGNSGGKSGFGGKATR